jgi:hypothetical protein
MSDPQQPAGGEEEAEPPTVPIGHAPEQSHQPEQRHEPEQRLTPEPPTVPIERELEPPTVPIGAVAKRRTRRWPFVVLGVLLVAGVAAAWGFDPLVRWLITRQAHERGVEVEFRDWALSRTELVLADAKIELRGVVGIEAKLEQLTVRHDRGLPTGIAASGVDLLVEGGAMLLALDVAGWASDYSENFGLPARAEDLSLRWLVDGNEWLAIEQGDIRPDGDEIVVKAGQARAFGVALGKVGARWRRDQSTVDLGFGRSEMDEAPVRIEVKHASSSPSAVITLRPVPLEQLAGPLGVKLPIEGVVASGRAELQLSLWGMGAITGKVDGAFEGYAPPAPRELGGIVFGKTTELSTEFEIDSGYQMVSLSETTVKHGALKLAGDGSIQRNDDHAIIALKLRGDLRCTDLAAAAARVPLPSGFPSALPSGFPQLPLPSAVPKLPDLRFPGLPLAPKQKQPPEPKGDSAAPKGDSAAPTKESPAARSTAGASG